jgi:hypothetical protein
MSLWVQLRNTPHEQSLSDRSHENGHWFSAPQKYCADDVLQFAVAGREAQHGKEARENDWALAGSPRPSSPDRLSGKQEANMNWIKCTDVNKQPIYVNIENATSIFWVEQEKASIIGFPCGTDSIKVIEKPEIIIRGA